MQLSSIILVKTTLPLKRIPRKTPMIDVGSESHTAEVQVEDDNISSTDELEEDDDEGPDIESVE